MQATEQGLTICGFSIAIQLGGQGIELAGEESAQGCDDRCVATGLFGGKRIIKKLARLTTI